MKKTSYILYTTLLLFTLYFNEILILNEKFLILVIFITFILAIRNRFSGDILSFFDSRSKDLAREIFLTEFVIDAKYKFVYLYSSLDLARKKLFVSIYKSYLQSINFVSIFYYNYTYRQTHSAISNNIKGIVDDAYFLISKKHSFIKLNFLYRSYYYIFNKFKSV